MVTKIKKIGVLSLAKVHAIVFGFVGLVAGIVYSFSGLIIDTLVTIGWITSTETPGLSYGTLLAFQALIGMPILLAIHGFILGAIVAFLYNVLAKWFRIWKQKR